MTPLIFAALAALSDPTACDAPLDGSWLLTFSEPGAEGSFHAFTGLIGEVIPETGQTTDLSVFITESSNHPTARRFAIGAWQDCTQTLADGAIEVVCTVRASRDGAYNPDRFRIQCVSDDQRTAILLTTEGRVLAEGLQLRKVGQSVR